MRDHGRLEAFRLADALALRVYASTRSFPSDERFGLTAQLRRSAVSVAANIVEGSARLTHGEYVHFLGIAYASAKELQYELSLSLAGWDTNWIHTWSDWPHVRVALYGH